jgi:hypothetical protein
VIDGVEIEMFVNSPFQMRRYFEEDRQSGRGVQPHLCSTGRIIFDPQGVMASLQAERTPSGLLVRLHCRNGIGGNFGIQSQTVCGTSRTLRRATKSVQRF